MSDRMRPSAGDIDDLLTDFFRREQPDPWPRLAAPDSEAKVLTAAPRVWKKSGVSGRYALAASVALLAITSIWLTGRAPAPFTGPNPILDHNSKAELKTGIDKRPKPIKKVDLRELNRAEQ